LQLEKIANVLSILQKWQNKQLFIKFVQENGFLGEVKIQSSFSCCTCQQPSKYGNGKGGGEEGKLVA